MTAIETLGDLVTVIATLPAGERERASERLDRVVELGGARRDLALGLLALDLAPALGDDDRPHGAQRTGGPRAC